MSRLYHTEQGRVVPTLCEELAIYRRARKGFHLPGTGQPATLYLLARPYPQSELPLRLAVNGIEIPGPVPDGEAHYHWFEVSVPPGLLQPGSNALDLWCDAHALNGWSLALEDGHRDPESWLSTDGGGTWRNERMGYLNVCRGEYVVRLRLAEGSDPAPPAVEWEDRASPRVQHLASLLPEAGRQPGRTLDRVRALTTWACRSWVYRCEGGIYAPWDAETILAWGKAWQGHDGREPIVMCVHYAVTLVSACMAVGIPARCAIFAGSVNGHNGHFTAEVWLDEWSKWVMVDPTLDAILFRDGSPLSVTEIQQAGDDLADLVCWGPGYEFQQENPFIEPWVERTFVTGLCFRHRSLWPRTNLLSRPELSPGWHGSTAYCETDLVWEPKDLDDGFGMFPYFGDAAYFNAAPADFSG